MRSSIRSYNIKAPQKDKSTPSFTNAPHKDKSILSRTKVAHNDKCGSYSSRTPPQQVKAQAHGQAAALAEAKHKPRPNPPPPPPWPTLTMLMAERSVGIPSGPTPAHPASSCIPAYRPAHQQRLRPFRG